MLSRIGRYIARYGAAEIVVVPRGRYESLLILNKDIHSHQELTTHHFRYFVRAGAAVRDVSPEYALDYIHEPFHYALRPGQGIVLVTTRDGGRL